MIPVGAGADRMGRPPALNIQPWRNAIGRHWVILMIRAQCNSRTLGDTLPKGRQCRDLAGAVPKLSFFPARIHAALGSRASKRLDLPAVFDPAGAYTGRAAVSGNCLTHDRTR